MKGKCTFDKIGEPRITLLKLVIFTLLIGAVVVLGGCAKSPATEDATSKYDVINGEWVTLEGRLGIRFDVDGDSYRLLPVESQYLLATDFELEKSESIVIQEPHLGVVKEYVTEDKGDQKVSYELYFIQVELDAMVPTGAPREIHNIRFQFPAVLEIRDALEAIRPTSVPYITFTIENFPSERHLAASRWWKHALYGIGLAIVALVAVAIGISEDSGTAGLIGTGAGIGSLYYWYLTFANLWIISPIITIIVGTASVVGIVQIVRHLSK